MALLGPSGGGGGGGSLGRTGDFSLKLCDTTRPLPRFVVVLLEDWSLLKVESCKKQSKVSPTIKTIKTGCQL